MMEACDETIDWLTLRICSAHFSSLGRLANSKGTKLAEFALFSAADTMDIAPRVSSDGARLRVDFEFEPPTG